MKGRIILIADDEAYLTQILAFNIEKTGARVLVARNGAEACQLAEANLPDLILSDFQMPVMDGLSACKRLKQTPATSHIPVIMLTARGHKVPPEELAQTNIRFLLPKPFSAKDLIVKIREILSPDQKSPDIKEGHNAIDANP
ncbi:MAG: response regulator [Planctomycetota bacterium]|nr:response regulator [Planctomycetota bacterium]